MAKFDPTPHDTFVRKVFSDMDVARDYFRNFLPPEIVKKLDLSKLELDNTSYVSDEQAKYFSDLVFNCPYAGMTIQLSLLLEHKSTPVPYIAFQLLRYMLEKWSLDIQNKTDLQVILPVVLYHGKTKWQKREFVSYFEGIDAPLLKYLPSFDYHLTDVSSYSDEEIMLLKVGFLFNTLLVMKHGRNEQFVRENFALLFRPLPPNESGRNKLAQIFVYLTKITEISGEEYTSLLDEVHENTKSEIMSTYDMLIEKGRQSMQKEMEQVLLQEKRKAEQEKRKAEQEKRKAEQEKRKAEQEKRKAEQEKRKAEQEKHKSILKMYKKDFPVELIAELLGIKVTFVKKVIEADKTTR